MLRHRAAGPAGGSSIRRRAPGPTTPPGAALSRCYTPAVPCQRQ